MIDDLVKRLREYKIYMTSIPPEMLIEEAAARIEVLETLLAEAKSPELRNLSGDNDEIKRDYFLRGQLAMRERCVDLIELYGATNDEFGWNIKLHAKLRALEPVGEQ